MPNNFIAFNLEGTLSPQESAAELMKLFPGGDKVYSVISRYDELMKPDRKEGYQPGDILALIIPSLVLHRIQEGQIVDLAAQATLTGGAANLVSQLECNSWKIFCLTSAYEQYALRFTHKLGIYAHHTASTSLPLNEMIQTADKGTLNLISRMEKEILELSPGNDDLVIKQRLDAFYWEQLPRTNLVTYLEAVKPLGGQRKLEALNELATRFEQPLSKWVMVGGNMEDVPVLQAVNRDGGLAIAFNADKAVLPYASPAVASTNIADVLDVLLTWQRGGSHAAERLVKEKERIGGRAERGYFHWLPGKTDISGVAEMHQRLRLLIKEEASKPVL
jgi:predicted HAD superfamily phosphohydrolase